MKDKKHLKSHKTASKNIIRKQITYLKVLSSYSKILLYITFMHSSVLLSLEGESEILSPIESEMRSWIADRNQSTVITDDASASDSTNRTRRSDGATTRRKLHSNEAVFQFNYDRKRRQGYDQFGRQPPGYAASVQIYSTPQPQQPYYASQPSQSNYRPPQQPVTPTQVEPIQSPPSFQPSFQPQPQPQSQLQSQLRISSTERIIPGERASQFIGGPQNQQSISKGSSNRGGDSSAHGYYFPPRMPLPLPTCFHNPTGYVCCNPMLNDLMVETYMELQARPHFHTCNINQIALQIQKRAESRFNTTFETLAGFEDFAQKVHFGGNLVCKIELGGKYMLAYGTVKNVAANYVPPDNDETTDSFSNPADALINGANVAGSGRRRQRRASPIIGPLLKHEYYVKPRSTLAWI